MMAMAYRGLLEGRRLLMHIRLELGLVAVLKLSEHPRERDRAQHLAALLLEGHERLVGLAAMREEGGEAQLPDEVLKGLRAKEHRKEGGRVDEARCLERRLTLRVVLEA